MVMEEQGMGKKEGLGSIEVPDEVLEGGVEIVKTTPNGMDEDEALEGTTDVGKDQTKILEDSVCIGKDQDRGVGMDRLQHEVLKSSNEAGKIQEEVLNDGMDVVNVQAVVVEAGFDKDNTENNVLEDAVAVDKVQENESAFFLHSGLDMDSVKSSGNHVGTGMDMEVQNMGLEGCLEVQDKVLEGCVEVDKGLEGGLDIEKFQDKVLKGGAAMDKVQDKVLVLLNTSEDGFVKGTFTVDGINDRVLVDNVYVGKVLDEVLEEAVDTDKVQNKKEWCGVDVDKSLDEFQKISVDVNENSVDMEEVLDGQEWVETMRCQVKITTRHNVQLRMANHTSRDVYVRLLVHGDRIAIGSGKEAYCSDSDRMIISLITCYCVLSVNCESFTQIIVKIE